MHNILARGPLAWIRSVAIGFALVSPAIGWSQVCPTTCNGTGGVQFSSPTGDYIGQGQSRSYSAPPHLLTAVRTFDNGVWIRLNMPQEGGTGDDWNLHISMPGDVTPVPGTYNNATRWPFNDLAVAGLDFSGMGRGCNQLTGQFTIHEATFKQDNSVQSVAVDFRQSCENTMPVLVGQVRFNSSVPFTLGPVVPGVIVDSDGDGIPDNVETQEGRNPLVKDNDVFGNARLFAMQQYRDFLAREGDAQGIDYWAGQIASGAISRAQMVDSFLSSGEFEARAAAVARLYFAYFLRIPDYQGLSYWIQYAASGNSLATISELFAESAEFRERYGPMGSRQFVMLVYKNVLAREPDAAGFAYWTYQLDNRSMNWGQVMLAFSDSEEYRAFMRNEALVTLVYMRMLGRAPDTGGFNSWVFYLDGGNSVLSLINQVLNGAEYRGRFLP